MKQTPELQLFIAVGDDDFAAAQAAIDAGASVDASNVSTEETPLIMAARMGKEKMGLWLLEKGANPNARTPRRRDALGYACKHSAALSHALLDRDAHPETHDAARINLPIQNAIKAGFDDVATRLIEKGAKVNALDNARISSAVCAALWGSRAIFDRVCAAGANLQLVDNMGVSELEKPLKLGYRDLTLEQRCNAALGLISAGADIQKAETKDNLRYITQSYREELLPMMERILAAPAANEERLQQAAKQTLLCAEGGLLDNPSTWRNFRYLLNELDAKDELISRADLADKQAPDGSNYLEYGVRCIGFNAWQEQTQGSEFALKPADLLNKDGGASTILHNILAQNDGPSLFSYAFWKEAGQEELKAVCRAVPEEKRENLPLMGLLTVKRQDEVNRGVGR